MASSAPYLGPLAQYAGEDDAEENEAGPPDTLLALPGYIRARQAALKKLLLLNRGRLILLNNSLLVLFLTGLLVLSDYLG